MSLSVSCKASLSAYKAIVSEQIEAICASRYSCTIRFGKVKRNRLRASISNFLEKPVANSSGIGISNTIRPKIPAR